MMAEGVARCGFCLFRRVAWAGAPGSRPGRVLPTRSQLSLKIVSLSERNKRSLLAVPPTLESQILINTLGTHVYHKAPRPAVLRGQVRAVLAQLGCFSRGPLPVPSPSPSHNQEQQDTRAL